MDKLTSTALSMWLVFLSLPTITQLAVTLILVSVIIVHIVAYNERTIHDGPSIFTTTGIFFTFLGIAEGLYGFDPLKIDASIPSLLDGLKTAFIASVVGVGAALSIKIRFALFGFNYSTQSDDIDGATIDDLHRRLVSIERSIIKEQTSLISETIISRDENSSRLDALSRSQEAFLSRMADGNSKALISALQEVIRDFNLKISEQFGDNFKQLNTAVGRLLEWQDQYRSQISQMIEQQTRVSNTMDVASKSYVAIVSKSETFTKSAESLSQLLTGIEEQRRNLSGTLEKLGSLLDRASTGLPQIESKITELTQQMTSGVKQNNEDVTKAIRASAENIQNVIAGARTMMLEANQSANTQVNDHMRSLADKTSEQFTKLDAALETELSKSISSLGRQLTALSRQFVDDYAPLTERLRALVQTGQA